MLGTKLSFAILGSILVAILVEIKAAKILALYPGPSISHQVVFRPITLELLKRGHELTVVTTDPMFPNGNTPKNLTEIDIHDISYSTFRNEFSKYISEQKTDLFTQTAMLTKVQAKLLEEQVNVKAVREVIFNQTSAYDLILLEAIFMPYLAVSHKFNAPTILISSFGPPLDGSATMGIPTHPILYPSMAHRKLYNLTIWNKINEFYNYYTLHSIVNSEEKDYNELLKKVFGPSTPPISVLKNYVDMLFLNIHSIWEGNYPVPPNVIYIGGLHQKPSEQLPQEFQRYLDASDKGVIYFSFGTNVKASLLPREKIEIFANVFSKLPYNIIWKWDDENFQAKSSNVKIVKWAPQADLLRHPNVKAFITQGGLQSTDEAITAGVPLIGIPMLWDQGFNVEKYIFYKIGVGLDFDNITEEKLRNAIVEVIENTSYEKNIARLRSLMMDQPQQSLEKAIWWIEYVLRHKGAKHLRSPAANISWAEYLELNLIGLVLLGSLITIVLLIVITRFLISHLRRNVKKYKLKMK